MMSSEGTEMQYCLEKGKILELRVLLGKNDPPCPSWQLHV